MALSSLRYGSVAKNDLKKDIRETTETSLGFRQQFENKKSRKTKTPRERSVIEHLSSNIWNKPRLLGVDPAWPIVPIDLLTTHFTKRAASLSPSVKSN
jgi:hypothetical protein